MGLPGILQASLPTVCPSILTRGQSFVSSSSTPASSSPSCSWRSADSGNSYCLSDRRLSSFSSSTSLSEFCGTRLLHGPASGTFGKRRGSSDKVTGPNDSGRLCLVVCAATESGTLRKESAPAETEDDSAVRSQGAATMYGDDTIVEDKKVKGAGEEDADAPGIQEGGEGGDGGAHTEAPPERPRRINFDYGFQAKFLRTGPQVPNNVFGLAFENFGREWKELRRTYSFAHLEEIDPARGEGGLFGLLAAYSERAFVLLLRGIDTFFTKAVGVEEAKPVELHMTAEQGRLRAQLDKLVLSNDKVWERERSRPAVKAPWWILGPYYFLCAMLDVLFNKRPIQRFWFLETVARMPYFSYISMLHLYETLGWWRSGVEVRKVHFAEEWNEMHHLKIMESLGGDLEWSDRFIGQHAAFFYYWILNSMFLISPSVAYNFSELIEAHAVDTYEEFADANKELLKTLPPPPVAVAYYESDDLYMYDEFQTSRMPESRRPVVNNLYDVFMAISGDEAEHVKTMVACQDYDGNVISPHRQEKMKGNVSPHRQEKTRRS